MSYTVLLEIQWQHFVLYGAILPKIKLNNGVNLFRQTIVKKKRKYQRQFYKIKKIYFQFNFLKIMHREWSFLIQQKDGINLYFKFAIMMNWIYKKFWKHCKMFQKINQEIQFLRNKNNNSMKTLSMSWIKHAKLFQITLYKSNRNFKLEIL